MKKQETFVHIKSLDRIINLDHITKVNYYIEPMAYEEGDFPHLEVYFVDDAPHYPYPSLDLRGKTAKKVWEFLTSVVTYEVE